MKLLATDVSPGQLIELADDDGFPVMLHVLDTVHIGGTVHVDALMRPDADAPSPWGDDEAVTVTVALDDIETVYLRGGA
jgi:hypothetical protein